MLDIRRLQNGVQVLPRPDGSTAPTLQGELAVSSVDGNLYYNNGSSSSPINTSSNVATLTNKTIAVGSNHITSTVNTAAQFNASTGDLESSVTTDTELSYVHGVTSSIQAQLNAITGAAIDSLIGDVSATGPGAAAATVNSVGGSSAANIHSAELAANAATNLNTPSTIVKRDSSGNFSAGTITATLSGNATNVSGVVAIVNGGTGQTTANAAYGALSPMTTTGDIEYESAPGVASRLPIGLTNQLLSVSAGGIPHWSTFTALTNPMTSTGDLIYSSDNLGTPTRLPIGTAGQVLEVVAGIPTWTTPASPVPSGTISPYGGTIVNTAVITAQSNTSTNSEALTLSTQFWGQSFTTTSAIPLASVILNLNYTGGTGPTGTMTVQVYTSSAGVPGTLIATSNSVNANTIIGGGSSITFPFSAGTNLANSTQYVFILNSSGIVFNGSAIGVRADGTNPYGGGTEVFSSNSGGSYITTSNDLQFQVVSSTLPPPTGYLFCDGTSYLIATYPALAAALFDPFTGNYAYGSVDSTHFNVPTGTGLFLRGADPTGVNDPDFASRTAIQTGGNTGGNVGSFQADQFGSHSHVISLHGNSPVVTAFVASSAGVQASTGATNNTGGNQTNPKNIYVNYIIKT